jgi:ABC-type Mn2+/Zn2+ transport system ATPase subunit
MRAVTRLPPQPFLSLFDAAFRLGDRLAFENTSWVFRRPEQWAILGPNGSGKSLFADALRGRLPLVRGELRYHYRPPPGLCAEEAIGHVSFDDRKWEIPPSIKRMLQLSGGRASERWREA